MENQPDPGSDATIEALWHMSSLQRKYLNKGGLSVGLVVTRHGFQMDFPLKPAALITSEGGQVAGLGKAAVQKILSEHGIGKTLAEEAGRTSRGSIGLMKGYVEVLNSLAERNLLNLRAAESWWIDRVRDHFNKIGPKFHFDHSKSVEAAITHLFSQAEELQKQGGGTHYVGALLQHLVGAKLDVVLGKGCISHHGATVADGPTARNGDFEIGGVVIHVTTHPTEALIRKISDNLAGGLRPLIVSTGEGVDGAAFLLKASPCHQRVDVIDVWQFLVANVYERSFFQASECQTTLAKVLERYNEIVSECEADPLLRIQLIPTPSTNGNKSRRKK
jgi:hypothetical protein